MKKKEDYTSLKRFLPIVIVDPKTTVWPIGLGTLTKEQILSTMNTREEVLKVIEAQLKINPTNIYIVYEVLPVKVYTLETKMIEHDFTAPSVVNKSLDVGIEIHEE